MNFYLLEGSPTGWDVANGFVIRAPNEMDARRLAAEQAGDERAEFWLNPNESTCVDILEQPYNGQPEVLLRSFRAG